MRSQRLIHAAFLHGLGRLQPDAPSGQRILGRTTTSPGFYSQPATFCHHMTGAMLWQVTDHKTADFIVN